MQRYKKERESRIFRGCLQAVRSDIDVGGLVKKRYKSLSIKKKCKLLGISNNAVYYKKTENPENIQAMKAMDKFYLDHPTAGARTMRWRDAANHQARVHLP